MVAVLEARIGHVWHVATEGVVDWWFLAQVGEPGMAERLSGVKIDVCRVLERATGRGLLGRVDRS